MEMTPEKLSRISALRPRSPDHGLQPSAGTSRDSEQLIGLLDGEKRINRFGSHIVVRNRFPQPLPEELDDRALRLLAPHFVEELRDPAQWLFLDTETTGLAGGTGTYAFMVGLAWWEEDRFVTEQYFMRNHGEEPSMLSGLLERFSRRAVLVTYNGRSFDWPLLQTRFQMCRLGPAPAPSAHLDFLHPARQLWRLCFPSVALEQLERHVLRLERGGDIPSEAIPQRYFDFIRGGPPEPVVEIFHHNLMDLRGLAFLALHMVHILADPGKNDSRTEELFGISRLLQKRGEERLAGQIYRRALEGGLPKAAERIAQRELAFMAKRGGDYELSNALWEKLLDGTPEGLKAYEQLAIYYEHYAHLNHRAAALSREALVRLQEASRSGRIQGRPCMRWHASFQHRLDRLIAKLADPRQTFGAGKAAESISGETGERKIPIGLRRTQNTELSESTPRQYFVRCPSGRRTIAGQNRPR